MLKKLIEKVEKGYLPDPFIRFGIRYLLKQRLSEEKAYQVEINSLKFNQFLQQLKKSPLAIETEKANEQHYEIPAKFYDLVLGKHKKYSCCFFKNTDCLDEAEHSMLELYTKRAEIEDGMKILELGCGWGSLTLYLACNYPNAKIITISNSNSQREYIESQAQKLQLNNIQVITEDINQFSTQESFDRIVSIEMFEHVRNYEVLFKNMADWLRKDGMVFIHIFCHRYCMYPFLEEGDDNWMGRYFFSGGQMPAADTLLFFQQHLNIKQRWMVDGRHYEKTANLWLKNIDQNKQAVLQIFKQVYGDSYQLWFQRWRIFFLSCAELFGYQKGNQWMVGHFLFKK